MWKIPRSSLRGVSIPTGETHLSSLVPPTSRTSTRSDYGQRHPVHHGCCPGAYGFGACFADRNIGLSLPLIITKDKIDEGVAIAEKAFDAADAYTEWNHLGDRTDRPGKIKMDSGRTIG